MAMGMRPRLDLRQSQTLVMTPQLQQAIKLLQLSNLELSTYVEQELEQNPLLEAEDVDRHDDFGEPPKSAADDSAVFDARDDGREGAEMARNNDSLDVDYDNVWNHDSAADAPDSGEAFANWSKTGGRADFDESDPNFEQTLIDSTSLRDHLLGQLTMDVSDPADRLIGLHLIDMLDESGYLVGADFAELAKMLGCSVERIEAVLAVLQHFDPPGVFARTLGECLGLQLRDRNRLDPAMQALLDNLGLLARRDMPGLLKVCGIDVEDLTEMIAEIKALNPKPGLAFDSDITQAVIPDVLMRAMPGGGWVVELNNDTLPRVLVNTRYHSEISKNTRSREDKQYLAERFQSANWLVKSLHQRATTILKVATELVRQQEAFFTKGVQHLRPLVLRDIAQAIGMHESTVSRVTTSKYLASARGIYELKYFFTTAIANAEGGESHSAESVRHRIKSMIDAEPIGDILSDDKIVELLHKEGVDIARRTVAKYREALRIPSSVQRRREKGMGM